MRASTLQIPAGTEVQVRMSAQNPQNLNSAVVMVFQFGKVLVENLAGSQQSQERLRVEATALLLGSMMREPCFNTLRTKQQLGYVVSCGSSQQSYGIAALQVIVQGAEFDVEFIRDRIEVFLKDFEGVLASISDQDFRTRKKVFTQTLLRDDLSLSERSGRYWREMLKNSRGPVFDRRKLLAQEVGTLNLPYVLSMYTKKVLEARSLISVSICGKEKPQPCPAEIHLQHRNGTRIIKNLRVDGSESLAAWKAQYLSY